ncbi:MAG: M28 family peptidase [Flavobacteriales bacterium]
MLAVLCIYPHAGVDVCAQQSAFVAIDREARSGAKGYDWLYWSTEHIGHRLTGTSHGTKAERAADSLFRVGGIERVSFFPFTAQAWQRRTVDLTLSTGDSLWPVQAVALAHTPDSSRVTATLLDAGNGLAEDFTRLGDRVRGAGVLMNLGLVDAPEGKHNLHRSEKTALAIAAGAASILFINNVEGHVLLTGTASVDGYPIAIPVACISSEDGADLRSNLVGGGVVRADLSMTNSNGAVTARNVIAEIRGTTKPDEVIVVGGHLDCWDLASGATDNGLGSFSILDLARCFSALALKPARTIRFVLFMGEEQGLLGSSALVETWRKSGELDKVKCMINLDMTGGPFGFNVVGPAGWGDVVKNIGKEIAALDTTFHNDLNEHAGLHSDHQPFMLRGVPVIAPLSDLGAHVYGCYHSSCDDINLVDPRRMVDNVRFTGMLLLGLSNAANLPDHFTDEALRDRLRAEGLEDKLRLQKDWRW